MSGRCRKTMKRSRAHSGSRSGRSRSGNGAGAGNWPVMSVCGPHLWHQSVAVKEIRTWAVFSKSLDKNDRLETGR